jgi:hypothetical protein
MLGEVFDADANADADARARRIPNGSVLRPSTRRRAAVPGMQRRLRAPDDVPSSGQIVFRAASQILR